MARFVHPPGRREEMTLIGDLTLDVMGSSEKVFVRLFAPMERPEIDAWVCRFEIDGPIQKVLDVHGTTSLQAISLALKAISTELYGSDIYSEGRLGFDEDFGGFLTLPAPSVFLDVAPYPF